MTRRPDRPERIVYEPRAYLYDDKDAIRHSLMVYARVSAELPELMRAADRLGVPIKEITRLASVDRGRVHRAIRNKRDIDPEATRETAEELRHNVMSGAYVEAEQTDSVPENWLRDPAPVDYGDAGEA